MVLAPLLYNITFDSQTRILYFWDKAGHEIYHCEIPSPAPALPTVSVAGDFLSPETTSNANWVNLVYGQSTVITMPANDVETVYVHTTSFNYDVTKSYGVIQWQTTAGTLAGRVEVSVVNNSGLVAIKNVSSATISIKQARIAVCSSNLATVVTVYDSSNNPYNAFKYTLSGTDYYYVLDGTQTDWIDDLASIGYHLPLSCWFMQDKSDKGIQQYMEYVFDTSGNYIIADTSKIYTVICGYKANGDSVGNSFSIGYNSGNDNKMWARSDGGYVTVSRLDYLES